MSYRPVRPTFDAPTFIARRTPENYGPKWFELEPEDGMYIPEGTPHRYRNVSGRPATLFFIVGPTY